MKEDLMPLLEDIHYLTTENVNIDSLYPLTRFWTLFTSMYRARHLESIMVDSKCNLKNSKEGIKFYKIAKRSGFASEYKDFHN